MINDHSTLSFICLHLQTVCSIQYCHCCYDNHFYQANTADLHNYSCCYSHCAGLMAVHVTCAIITSTMQGSHLPCPLHRFSSTTLSNSTISFTIKITTTSYLALFSVSESRLANAIAPNIAYSSPDSIQTGPHYFKDYP